MAYGFGGMGGFPLGLPGMLKGKVTTMPINLEEQVTEIQDQVVRVLSGTSELYRQAMYQYLYGLGHRIPTGSPRANLLSIAKRESTP